MLHLDCIDVLKSYNVLFLIEIKYLVEGIFLPVKFDILDTIDCPFRFVSFYDSGNHLNEFFGVIEKVFQSPAFKKYLGNVIPRQLRAVRKNTHHVGKR